MKKLTSGLVILLLLVSTCYGAAWLKQSTAVDIAIGPFLDDADGKTAETALSLTQADVRLKMNNANWGQKGDATSCTHEENGWYECPLNTTDTGTLGILVVNISKTGALPVWKEFVVLPANVYDSIVGGSDALQVDTIQVNGTAQTARDLGASVLLSSGTGAGQISLSSGAVTVGTNNDKTGYTASTVSDKTGYALAVTPPTGAEIADAVWDEAIAGHAGAGSTGAALSAAAPADPWATALPGAYAAGTAGKILGNYSQGGGNTAVNHNTTSADNLRYTTALGAGISGAVIKAYLKTDYDAGNRTDAYVKGRTVTDVNGRWTNDLYLDGGYTYTILFYKSGTYGPDTKEVTLP